MSSSRGAPRRTGVVLGGEKEWRPSFFSHQREGDSLLFFIAIDAKVEGGREGKKNEETFHLSGQGNQSSEKRETREKKNQKAVSFSLPRGRKVERITQVGL